MTTTQLCYSTHNWSPNNYISRTWKTYLNRPTERQPYGCIYKYFKTNVQSSVKINTIRSLFN